ncbi:putative oxidoreductase [Chitinophaga skermanii]|uniref:Putative oxidoreductase n=1 Tax=Chitinophaga skermanii TaxID=331697 RepID=A0A327QRM8_9BACT|nr:DoxX family protein [Chitinophaga skermanii]RAJ06555.1 putative oxidoreductase [Chitinophaga skermanii]
MREIIENMTNTSSRTHILNVALLVFRIVLSLQLMIVHGLKKIGIGVEVAEQVPNPLHLPEVLNSAFAIAGNLVFPVFIIFGLFTRLAILPVLAITLTGYFVLHAHDPLLVKDVPFMYSLSFLFLLVVGPGGYSVDCWLNRRMLAKWGV